MGRLNIFYIIQMSLKRGLVGMSDFTFKSVREATSGGKNV